MPSRRGPDPGDVFRAASRFMSKCCKQLSSVTVTAETDSPRNVQRLFVAFISRHLRGTLRFGVRCRLGHPSLPDRALALYVFSGTPKAKCEVAQSARVRVQGAKARLSKI